jgi:hypothetical protein
VYNYQVVRLLAYISDKDLFAEFYRYVFSLNLWDKLEFPVIDFWC